MASSREALTAHLRAQALRIDGPFRLRSGATSDWYLDARQTTMDGAGSLLVGEAMAEAIGDDVVAVGGMTMGADPVALATAAAASRLGRPLRAFSVRAAAKDHGTGGRIVGPVSSGDSVAVVEDTTTTGGALLEAIDVLEAAGMIVAQVVALVDRSEGKVAALMAERGLEYSALLTPTDLGVE
jgi:orotate phosphoribosyltransferase